MSTNAAFQPHRMTYDIRTTAPSTETAVKKKFVYGDRSASSRIRCTKNTAQETVWKTYPAGVFQKNAVELNTVNDAIARTRAGGATVPPKVTGFRPPAPQTYNVPWVPVTTDILGFPFNGTILEMEASETGQYQAMVVDIPSPYDASIYVSVDYGHTWAMTIQENTSGYGNSGISFYAISRNGQYHAFVAAHNGQGEGVVYQVVISGDYGSTWTRHDIDVEINAPTMCISNDGQTVILDQYVSFDGANTFSRINLVTDISGGGTIYTFSATMSTTAQHITIASNDVIWVSSDYGNTFYSRLSSTTIGNGSFTGSVNMTPDGQRQYVSRINNDETESNLLYISHNYGATWYAVVPRDPHGQILLPAYWTKRSISASGQEQVVATVIFGLTDTIPVRTYYSSDEGFTWTWLDLAMPPVFSYGAYTPLLTDKGLVNYTNTDQEPYQGTVYVSPPLSGKTLIIPTFNIDQPWRAITTDASGVPLNGTYVVEMSASATGQHILMLLDYNLYVSHNYGKTWKLTRSNVRAMGYMADLFSYMAVSRSGEHHVVVDTTDHILYISSDYGDSWRTQSYPAYIQPSICVSDDGQRLFFGNYISFNGGEQYDPIPFLGLGSGVDPATIQTTSNAMSDNGAYMTSVDFTAGRIYVSNDSGGSFQVVTTYINANGTVVALPGRFTGSICMSPDGQYQYATCFNPSLFLQSSDYGATWHTVDARDENGAPMQVNYYWTKRSIDPSTQHQIISNANAFHAYLSVDGGVHWKQLTKAFATRDEINSLTPIMTIQSALNSWKNEIYIYP